MRDVHIYGLYDPREPEVIHYVGKTSDLAGRLHVHVVTAHGPTMPRLRGWIKSLLAQGVEPQIRSLDVVPAAEWAQREEAIRLRMVREGHPLKNVNAAGSGYGPRATWRDLTGRTFGRWSALHVDLKRSSGYRMYWWCQCTCGQRRSVDYYNLLAGTSTGCGCARREGVARRNKANARHNLTGSPEYRAWQAIIQRCTNPASHAYRHYGGRGITVCERWLSFEHFYADIGPKPTPRHSIDRIDYNGHYEPANTRWATQTEQQRNKRNNRVITFQGRTQLLGAWAEELGVTYGRLHQRLFVHGWPVEKAFSTPSRRNEALPDITYQGRTQSLAAWSQEVGIDYGVLRQRLFALSWPVERAFSSLVRPLRRSRPAGPECP